MSRTYSLDKCYICGKQHSMNGLARTNHMRKHVREGILMEGKIEYPDGTSCITFSMSDYERARELYPKDAPFL